MNAYTPEGWPEKLAEHFTTKDFFHSDYAEKHGIENLLDEDVLENALRAAALAEEARAILGVPLEETSGFRCAELNKAVGGHPESAHRYGRAYDLIPKGMAPKVAFLALLDVLVYDKLVLETDGISTWLHLQVAPEGAAPRKWAFVGTKGKPFRRVR